MRLPLPAIAIIFQQLMAEASIIFLLMYLSHLRARWYHHCNGTNCFEHSKPQLMDCCTNQLKFKNWRQRSSRNYDILHLNGILSLLVRGKFLWNHASYN